MDSIIPSFPAGTTAAPGPSGESVFLNDGSALVTNLKCVFTGATRIYATSGITAVGMNGSQQKIVGAAFVAGVGLGWLYYREPNPNSLLFAIVCLAIAYGLYWLGRPWYTLYLHTAGGQYTPLKSRDQRYIAGVLMALNEAIMRRG
jgi:hypothetical protein